VSWRSLIERWLAKKSPAARALGIFFGSRPGRAVFERRFERIEPARA